MQETNNTTGQWLTIRVGRSTLSFAMPDHEGKVVWEPYVVKSGVSLSANLREAMKVSPLLQSGARQVRVLVDSPVLTVPVELFDEQQMVAQYHYTFPRRDQDGIFYNVIPDLNAVVVFSMNKDLRMVIDDHFQGIRLIAAVTPVWRYLHQRSYTGPRQKLYGYFHEKRLEVFSFHQNRFKFTNSFDVAHAHDALYFLLYVWNALKLQSKYDELHIVGDIPEQEWLHGELQKYVQKAYVIQPSADFNHAPVTAIKGMPYDLQTLFVKGR